MSEKNEKKPNWWAWLALVILLSMLFWQFQRRSQGPPPENLATSVFFERIRSLEKEQLKAIAVKPAGEHIFTVLAKIKDNERVLVTTATEEQVKKLTESAEQKGVELSVLPKDEQAWWVSLLPWVILGGIWIFFILYMRRMQGGGAGGLNSFAKSRPRTEIPLTKFSDVAGIDEAIRSVSEVVEFLKDPTKFTEVGAKIPKGVLLMGPPGTGKTLLARAVAGEAGVPFFSISGSDFVEMFVGVGAGRVRDLFAQAKKTTPCIVFIDEIDAMGKHRSSGVGNNNDEREQTLNQVFTEMDGFETNQGIIVLAATNRPDVLDKALLRAGRFDRHVEVGLPDVCGREKILAIHTRKKPLAEDVDLAKIARGTAGSSGADLENLANEAAMLAAREGKKQIEMCHFWQAQDGITMGEARRIIVSPKEKELFAYHEAGHTLVGLAMENKGGDQVHKVTIIPRGRAMGVTGFLPKEDRYAYSKTDCLARIKNLLGGRVAEEIVFGSQSVTTGAGNDLEMLTNLAQKMVCDWAMSDNLPLRTYGKRSGNPFLDLEFSQGHDYGEEVARQIDGEIAGIIGGCYAEVKRILVDSRDKLDVLAKALLEKETLSGDEVRAIVGGELESYAQMAPPAPPTPKAGKKDRVLRWLKRAPFNFVKWAKGKPWKRWKNWLGR